MSKRLSKEEITEGMKKLSGWILKGDAIEKQYTLGSFPEAIGFVNRVADLAEAVDHHPDILINYKRVKMTLTTHSEGGLTQKDLDLARKIEGAAGVN